MIASAPAVLDMFTATVVTDCGGTKATRWHKKCGETFTSHKAKCRVLGFHAPLVCGKWQRELDVVKINMQQYRHHPVVPCKEWVELTKAKKKRHGHLESPQHIITELPVRQTPCTFSIKQPRQQSCCALCGREKYSTTPSPKTFKT